MACLFPIHFCELHCTLSLTVSQGPCHHGPCFYILPEVRTKNSHCLHLPKRPLFSKDKFPASAQTMLRSGNRPNPQKEI